MPSPVVAQLSKIIFSYIPLKNLVPEVQEQEFRLACCSPREAAGQVIRDSVSFFFFSFFFWSPFLNGSNFIRGSWRNNKHGSPE